MKNKTILLGMIISGLVFCGSALARPSLTSMDAKLDQLLAGQQAILDDLERLRAELGISLTRCEDIEFSGTVWGSPANGIDLRRFTGSTLHFIGCNGNGCNADSFVCNFDASNLTLTFGTSDPVGSSLRALVDPGNTAGDDMTGNSIISCASAIRPDAISNAPTNVADARALCRSLGYRDGTVEAVSSNVCPKPSALDADGQAWTNLYSGAVGYGRSFTCSGIK